MDENVSSRKVVDLSIDDILPNRYQPRIKFDDNSIFELAESIKNHGVFQPILVRPIGDKYEIIAGERRYKASVLANKKTIPAIVMSLNDKDTVEIALIENVQRADLTPIEEAISYKKILDMGYIKQEELARKLGKNQSTIANKLRLLNLDESVQEALLGNKISERHARSLLKLKDLDDQKMMLKRIINERLTVRKTDEEIDKMLKDNDNEVITPVVINDQNETSLAEEEVIPTVEPIKENPNVFGFSNDEVDFSIPSSMNGSTVISSDLAEKVENVEVNKTDINKIEQEAAPLYEKKEAANMEELLEPEEVKEEKEEEKEEDIQIESIPVYSGKFFNFEMPEEETVEESTEPPLNFNNFVKAESTVEPEEAPSFEDFFKNQTTTSMSDSEPPKVTQYSNFEIDSDKANSSVSSDVITVSQDEEKSIDKAVTIIKEAISKLEAMGYSVDTDEIDLESVHQLIIKIDK